MKHETFVNFVIYLDIESWAFIPRIPTSLLKSAGDQYVHQFIKPGDRIVGGRPGLLCFQQSFLFFVS